MMSNITPIQSTALSLLYTDNEIELIKERIDQVSRMPGPSGDRGPQGIKGDKGLKGDKGERGDKGAKGDRGNDGSIGPQGKQGEPGPVGQKGDKGDQGERGERGATGDTGKPGPRGEQGIAGPKGDKGDEGKQGIQGVDGIAGERGAQGEPGPRGPKGDKGDKGDQGVKGDAGPQGERGDKGERGERGEQGERGERGEPGPSGKDAPDYKPRFESLLEEFNKKTSDNQTEINKRVDQKLRSLSSLAGGGGSYKLVDNADVDKSAIGGVVDNAILIYNPSTKKFVAESFVNVLERLKVELEVQYNRLIDVQGSFTYIGEASPGTATSAALWRIKRVEEVNQEGDINILWADGTADFTKIWDNRLGLSYS